MSCFICKNETFKAVTKICWLYGLRQKERGEYPLTLEDMNNFLQKVAIVNCQNYSKRYHDTDVEIEVQLFTDIPSFEIVPQDIKSTECWMYQCEDYMDKDETFKMVKDAFEWVKFVTGFTKEEMEETEWK